MVDSGPFAGRRFELIDGDLIDKMGQNLQHAYVLQMLSPLLGDMFGPKSVSGQLPIEVATPDQDRNQPEPDLVVLAGATAFTALAILAATNYSCLSKFRTPR